MTKHIVTSAFAATGVAAIASLALALPASAMPPPDPGPETAPANPTVILSPSPDGSLPIVPAGIGLLAGLGIGAAAVSARTARRESHQPSTA